MRTEKWVLDQALPGGPQNWFLCFWNQQSQEQPPQVDFVPAILIKCKNVPAKT